MLQGKEAHYDGRPIIAAGHSVDGVYVRKRRDLPKNAQLIEVIETVTYQGEGICNLVLFRNRVIDALDRFEERLRTIERFCSIPSPRRINIDLDDNPNGDDDGEE